MRPAENKFLKTWNQSHAPYNGIICILPWRVISSRKTWKEFLSYIEKTTFWAPIQELWIRLISSEVVEIQERREDEILLTKKIACSRSKKVEEETGNITAEDGASDFASQTLNNRSSMGFQESKYQTATFWNRHQTCWNGSLVLTL